MDDAVRRLRRQPECADLVRDAYLSYDVAESAERFRASAEFAAVLDLLGESVIGATVADVGAGNGIASWAFAQSGAGTVFAVDPSASAEVGLGAFARLPNDERIVQLAGVGEALPLDDSSCDIVYVRQTLHHAQSLDRFLVEVARVLKPGGRLLATREHVAESPDDLAIFLANHPTHHLVGNEHAFPLKSYTDAIELAGLELDRVLTRWDSVINAFPAARDNDELRALPRRELKGAFGPAGKVVSRIPGAAWIGKRYWLHTPGELVSFLAHKPHLHGRG
jgi:ubiquinone/menaquinone biosynthesis C-methylase UbiE